MEQQVQIKIIFKECEGEKTLDQIIEELVKESIKRIITKYDGIVYNEEQ